MQKFLLLFLLFSNILAKAQEYKFNVFTQEEGLPQSYVYDLAQTKNGFLYVATGDGLAIYGGDKFQKQTTRQGLSENFCHSLFVDSKQRVWIGHFEGGVSFIENGKIKKIDIKNTTTAKVVGFAEDADGTVYYANSAGNIYGIKNISLFTLKTENIESINDIKIRNQQLFIASQSGLHYVDLKTKKINQSSLNQTNNKNITSIDFFKNNNLAVAIEGEGVEIYERKGDDFKLIKTIANELESSRKAIKDILVTQKNTLYISLSGEGFKKIDLNDKNEITKINKIEAKNGLKNSFINKFFIDLEDNLWLASYGGGLFQWYLNVLNYTTRVIYYLLIM